MHRWVFPPELVEAAGTTDEDRIAFGVEESAGGEFANLPCIDRREIFEDWELGGADPVADRAGLTVGAFSPHQAGDEGIDLICKNLDLIHRSMSDYAIHLTAEIIGEADSVLSRMRNTGCAGASHSPSPATGVLSDAHLARVLDNTDPLATPGS